MVDGAAQYEGRGFAANSIRFLLSYGLKEEDLKHSILRTLTGW